MTKTKKWRRLILWMNEWMDVEKRMNEWINEWMNDLKNKWMNDLKNEWMNEWINGDWVYVRMIAWFNSMNERMDGWMVE